MPQNQAPRAGRRAVRADQKAARRQVILDRAWALFQAQTYDAINMADVARAAELAKGTVYLYFPTKEALFLAILEQQFAAWFDTVDAALGALPKTDDPARTADAIIGLLAGSLAAQPDLVRLFALAHVVLEHNIDHDAARRYKHLLRERTTHTGAQLEARLPYLRAGEGAQLLLRAYALVIGVHNLAHPAPVAADILAEDRALSGFQVAFETELTALLRALLCYYQHRP